MIAQYVALAPLLKLGSQLPGAWHNANCELLSTREKRGEKTNKLVFFSVGNARFRVFVSEIDCMHSQNIWPVKNRQATWWILVDNWPT